MNAPSRHWRFGLAVAFLVVAGCGRLPGGSAADSTAMSPSDTPTPTVSATPSSTPTPSQTGTQAFTSPALGYTVQLPQGLAYQRSTPRDSDFVGEDDFSNQKVGAPEQMDSNGIFLAIVVITRTGNQCLQHNLTGETVDRQDPVMVDGNAATLNILTLRSGEPSMVLNTVHNTYCYEFTFITLTKAVRDSNESSVVGLLASFRFGSGPAQ